MSRVCLDCGNTTGKRSNAKRCEECRLKHKTVYGSAYHKIYNKQHLEYGRKVSANFRKNHPDRVQKLHEERGSVYEYNYHHKLKQEVLSAYSKDHDHPACCNCGFDNIHALQLDHINGGGRQHRISLASQGSHNIYQWLRREGYPKGYQVLCANCNWIKRYENKEGTGPRKRRKNVQP